MIDRPPPLAKTRLPLWGAATALTALAIFVADVFTPPDCVVGGLYVVVVLMAGQFCGSRQLALIALSCAGLTVLAQVASHRYVLANDQAAYIGAFNTLVDILAIGLSCYFILRGRSAQAALRRAQADLAHVSRVTTMGELTASIAHEVNQPIAAVVTNAGACLRWLAADPPDLNRARQAAERIVRDGTRASEIIARIRQIFTRGAAQRQLVGMSQVAREAIELLGAEATRHGVSVRTDLAADALMVMADRVQLQQVITNLLLNGVDAMRSVATGRELTVTTRRTARDEVTVSVSDTGVGLDPEAAAHIFNAFYTTKPHGAGMGLSISRSIIEAHQGRLWATPNQPRGASFHFALPLAEEG
jgi:C4-dicarboxylate-specific signal transduction histidine kinase